jgi:hypothetical protein
MQAEVDGTRRAQDSEFAGPFMSQKQAKDFAIERTAGGDKRLETTKRGGE